MAERRRRGPRVARGFLPAESEAAFQQKVWQLARFMGWRLYHPPDNRPSGNTGRVQHVVPGFPDLTIVRGPRIVFAELKAEKGRLSAEQEEWIAALMQVREGVRYAVELACTLYDGTMVPFPGDPAPAVDVFVWRPSDWPEIEAALAR